MANKVGRPRSSDKSDYAQITVRVPLDIKAKMDHYLPNLTNQSQLHALINRGLQLYPMIEAVQDCLSQEVVPFVGRREVSEGDAIAFIASVVDEAIRERQAAMDILDVED